MIAWAEFGGLRASSAAEIRHDVAALDEPGFWAVVLTFEGDLTAVRFEAILPTRSWSSGEQSDRVETPWHSSLDRAAYLAAVAEVRERIAAGTVYQVNVCRVLSRPIGPDLDLDHLARALAVGNPAPYAGRIFVPDAGLDIVCASPELFLERRGDRLASAPMKGTAPTPDQLLPKDHTENVMITDLVRNDLSPVAVPGSVSVDGLCVAERHPGLAQLVSTVSCRLRDAVRWQHVLAATFPPGSVSGAPKSTALQAISDLEPAPRGPYCGAIGWVDNRDPERPGARLAVGIRTFWATNDDGERQLRFGTGAGITWGSDPDAEWSETQLKARRLIGIADGVIANRGRLGVPTKG